MVVGHVLAVAAHVVSLNLRSARGIALLPLHLLRVEQRHQPATSLVLFQRKKIPFVYKPSWGESRLIAVCCDAWWYRVHLPGSPDRAPADRHGFAPGLPNKACARAETHAIPSTNSVLGQTRRMYSHVAQSLVSGLDASHYLVDVSKQIRPRRQTSI
jgi:hypothetical protein